MSNDTLLRSATFADLSPEKIIEVLSEIQEISPEIRGSHATRLNTDSVALAVVRKYAPDFLELLATSAGQSFLLKCFLLPVVSERGPACQITIKKTGTGGTLTESDGRILKSSKRVSDATQDIEQSLLTEIDRRLRQAGATRTSAMRLTSVVGDHYEQTTLPAAVHAVSDFACFRRELRDASNNLIVSWHGILTWASPKAGVVAAIIHYTFFPDGTSRGIMRDLFLRWFFFEQRSTRQIEVSYECSAPDQLLSDLHSIEWRIIKEMVKLTRQHLCLSGAKSLSGQLAKSQAITQDKGNAQVQCADLHFSKTEPAWLLSQFWPTAQDYNESIQNLDSCTDDPEIKAGELVKDPRGLPRVVSGAFASVYRIQSSRYDLAVRCFIRPVRDQAERYRRISRFICSDDLPYTLDVHFIEKGILVRRQWFPIIKMEWVKGEPITSFVSRNLKNRKVLSRLRTKFWLMLIDLARAGVAHGDLQHGNMLIRNDDFVLLDYDGMYVPDLHDYKSREKGHPNYQHPARNSSHFGPYLDHFSAWIIDTALLAVQEEPALWENFGAGDESLLFKRADFLDPTASKLFQTLDRHKSSELNRRAKYLRILLSAPVAQIPALAPGYPDLVVHADEDISALPEWISRADI